MEITVPQRHDGAFDEFTTSLVGARRRHYSLAMRFMRIMPIIDVLEHLFSSSRNCFAFVSNKAVQRRLTNTYIVRKSKNACISFLTKTVNALNGLWNFWINCDCFPWHNWHNTVMSKVNAISLV